MQPPIPPRMHGRLGKEPVPYQAGGREGSTPHATNASPKVGAAAAIQVTLTPYAVAPVDGATL